ncbi:hypothetical protein FACS189485_09650 [Spirochaetia bacterium]|nr:hypothetical protein FACS189485_09650 [Spirochaetia bacterium]
MKNNITSENELYEPMRLWLKNYLIEKYPDFDVVTVDSHSERLDTILEKHGIMNAMAIGIDIQIDVLGIVKNNKSVKLFFIEAKKNALTLRDLGQLWAYCRLINPEEAFLLTAANFGTLDKILNVFKREDILDFGDGKTIRKMKVAIWNVLTNSPEMLSMIPKI